MHDADDTMLSFILAMFGALVVTPAGVFMGPAPFEAAVDRYTVRRHVFPHVMNDVRR